MALAFAPKQWNTFNGYAAITPNDFVSVVAQAGKAAESLYVGTSGNVSVVGIQGTTVLFKNVPSGTVLSIKAITVNATGTTAADIVALYRL